MEMRGFLEGAGFSNDDKSAQYSKLSSQDEDESWGAEQFMSTAGGGFASATSAASAGSDSYTSYLDDDDLAHALQADFQLPTPPAMSKRTRNSLMAGAVTLVTLVFFLSGSGRQSSQAENDGDAATPIVYDSGLTNVIRMSVSSRDKDILQQPGTAAATAVLTHNADTGVVELEVEHHSTRTVVAGGMAHVSVVRSAATDGRLSICTPMQQIPGAADMVQLLSHARGSLSAWVQRTGRSVTGKLVPGVECAGTLWHLRSNGEDALVCMMEDRIVEITTESMTMEVHSYVETPEGSPLDIPECEKHEEEEKPADEEVSMWAGNVSSTPWFVVPSEAIDGDVTAPVDPEDTTPPPSAVPKNATKDCIFIHGVGVTPTAGSSPILLGSYPQYWGKVHEVVPQCRSKIFLNVETTYRGWDNKSLQEQVCAAATYDASSKKSSMGVIEDRIVFTHSMGNMMLAGAIQAGVCHLGGSSSWYEVSGPMRGSAMASKVADICAHKGVYKYVASKMGFCTPDGQVTPAYTSLEPGYPGLDGIAATIASRLSGAMCGTSTYGLASVYSAELTALAHMAGFGDLNDGVVSWSSCDVRGSVAFSKDYHDSFYAPSVNHIDTSCYEGDGWWGLDRKPCLWYSQRE